MARPNGYNAGWTAKELSFAKNAKLTNNQVAEETGRTYAAVKNKRLELGIVVENKSIDYWSEDEVKYLTNNRHLTNQEVANKLNRTKQSVSLKRNRLKLEFVSVRYDDDEIEYIISSFHSLTVKQIAAYLGRSVSAVQSKAYELGITKKSDYWSKQEISILMDNFQTSNDSLTKMLSKTSEQIAYKKAYINYQNKKADRVDLLGSENIEEGMPFINGGKKLNQFARLLSVMLVGESFEFPASEYSIIIKAKLHIRGKMFRTKSISDTVRRIWRLA